MLYLFLHHRKGVLKWEKELLHEEKDLVKKHISVVVVVAITLIMFVIKNALSVVFLIVDGVSIIGKERIEQDITE